MKKLHLSLIIALCLCVLTGGVYAAWVYTESVASETSEMGSAKLEVRQVNGGGTIAAFDTTSIGVKLDAKGVGDHSAVAVLTHESTVPETIAISYTPKDDTEVFNEGLLSWKISVAPSAGSLSNLTDGSNELFSKTTSEVKALTLQNNTATWDTTIATVDIKAAIDSLFNASFDLSTSTKYDNFKAAWGENTPKFTIEVFAPDHLA